MRCPNQPVEACQALCYSQKPSWRYKAVRENDGTYSIRGSIAGLNYSEIVMTGVRGCNVQRVLTKLVLEQFYGK